MATVVNRTTLRITHSAHTPDFDPAAFAINIDLSPWDGVATRYRKLTGDVCSEMDQTEKDAIDATDW